MQNTGKGPVLRNKIATGENTMKRAVLISGLTALALAGTAVVAVAASHGKAGMEGHMGGRGAMMMPFDEIDTDGDGKITAAEMKAHAEARFGAADGNGDGFVDAAEMQARMLAQATARIEAQSARMIEKMDADGDGKLSATEMQQGPREGDRFERMLSRLDKDEDGAISRAEMDEARERWAAHRGGHGKGHGRGGDSDR
jgi:Ca2+-binding EF-hand superfamily protein